MNRALLWGGTGFNFGKKPERMQAYINSTARTREVAKQQGIDVFISNHNAYDGSVEKLAVKGSDGPNPFVLGVPTVQRALTVMNECAQATLALYYGDPEKAHTASALVRLSRPKFWLCMSDVPDPKGSPQRLGARTAGKRAGQRSHTGC